MTNPFGINALVVNTVRRGPGQMTGMGDASSTLVDLADQLTGGKVSQTQQQLDRLELALKVSIGASVVAAAVGLLVVFSGKR